MWVYTSKGMVSVVQHRDKPNHLLLRARCESHLKAFIGKIEDVKTFFLEDADYQHRALITRIDFDRMILEQVAEIKYPDFKGSIDKTAEGNKYYRACLKAWQAMNDAYRNLIK